MITPWYPKIKTSSLLALNCNLATLLTADTAFTMVITESQEPPHLQMSGTQDTMQILTKNATRG